MSSSRSVSPWRCQYNYNSKVSVSERLNHILTVYRDSRGSGHPDVEEVRELISKLSHDDITSLSEVLYDALSTTACSDHTEITNTILVSLPHKYRLHVLLHRDETPLHRAAWRGKIDSVIAIMSHLTSEEQLKLLSVQRCGKTPIDWASKYGHTDTVRLLGVYKERAEKQINTTKPAGGGGGDMMQSQQQQHAAPGGREAQQFDDEEEEEDDESDESEDDDDDDDENGDQIEVVQLSLPRLLPNRQTLTASVPPQPQPMTYTRQNTSSIVYTKQQEKRGGVNVSEIVSIMANGKAFIDLTINIPNIDEPHYQMTRTRGRVCLISNSFTGDRSARHGSEHDYNNLKNMFNKLGFVVAGQHKSFTAEEIVSTIHAETQLVVRSGRSVHEDLGMFVLVITSHGTEGSICGSDDVLIKLTDIYDLLSAKHFPAMKDKPKLIIVQACGGGRRERFVDDFHRGETSMSYNQSDSSRTADVTPHHTNTNYVSRGASNITADAQQADISVANLLIMQSSFDSFLAFRDTNVGSQFIRAITATFLKYAHLYDVEMLGKIVQESVSIYGVQISQEYDTTGDDERYITQMPKIISTLTGFRKIYLQPGVEMCTGSLPTFVRNPFNPCRPTTDILFLTDLVREERRGNDHIVRTTTLQFMLEKPSSCSTT